MSGGSACIVETWERPDRVARVLILERPDGRYSFEMEALTHEDCFTFWQVQYASGIHESLDAAEREARAVITWLRNEHPN
jgi:hypothetical protein